MRLLVVLLLGLLVVMATLASDTEMTEQDNFDIGEIMEEKEIMDTINLGKVLFFIRTMSPMCNFEWTKTRDLLSACCWTLRSQEFPLYFTLLNSFLEEPVCTLLNPPPQHLSSEPVCTQPPVLSFKNQCVP